MPRRQHSQPAPTPQRSHAWLWLIPLTLLFMRRWWGPGLPISPRGENMPQLSYLWMLRRLLADGDALRGWNPLVLGGQPTATARIYHVHLTMAAASWLSGLSPEWTLKLVQALMTILAGLGAYLLARRLDRSSGASVLAGVAFAFFPARIVLTVESLFVTCVWAGLPWVFWTYERARTPEMHTLRGAVAWGLAVAWIALTGPQWLLLAASPVLLYVLLREACRWLSCRGHAVEPLRRQVRTLALTMLVAGAPVVGLSAFYYLPVLVEADLLWSSHYVRVYPGVSRWMVPWPLLGRILASRWRPGFEPFGWEMARIVPDMAWYLGLALCGLALLGLARCRDWTRTVPLLGVLLASLLLAAGPSIPHNPAYAIVRRIPYVSDSVRNAFRYLWPASLCLAALAAGVAALAVALVLVDVWPLTRAYGTVDAYMTPEARAAYRWLDEAAEPGRYWAPFQLARPGAHYTDTAYGIRYNARPSINDDEYHSPSAPERATLLFRVGLRGQIEAPEGLSASAKTILDLANVRYLLLHLWPEDYEQSLDHLIAAGYQTVLSNADVALLENSRAQPYAQAFARSLPFAPYSDENVFALLPLAIEKGYALVEESAPFHPIYGATTHNDLLRQRLPDLPRPDVALTYTRPHAAEIVVAFQASAPSVLMISETWYPHWRVTVNGEPQPLLRVNGNFLGVGLPAGSGTACFRYVQPWYLWLGYAISAATALLLLTLALLKRPRRAAE